MAKVSRSMLRHLCWLAVIEAIGYAVLVNHYGSGVRGIGAFVLLGGVVLLVWMLFVMPTLCDFEVRGRGCRRPVSGKAVGCHNHGRVKRDAMFAALRMRNPGIAFRVMWLDGAQGGRVLGQGAPGSTGRSAGADHNRSQAFFNLASLFVAVVGAVAGVLALFVPK